MRNTKLIPNSNPIILQEILRQDFKGRVIGYWADHGDSNKYRITSDSDEAVKFYLIPGMNALREAESNADPGATIYEKCDDGSTIYYYEESLINWEELLKVK